MTLVENQPQKITGRGLHRSVLSWSVRTSKGHGHGFHDAALVVAGIVGSTVAFAHGVLTQRLMVRPIDELTAGKLPHAIRRLVAGLLHYSAFNWFVSGLALLIAAYSFGREARLATGLPVGALTFSEL